MKVICLKHCYEELLTTFNLYKRESLNIYGIVKKRENLINILHFGNRHLFLTKIGEIKRGAVKTRNNFEVVGIVNNDNVDFWVKKGNGWTLAKLELVDLNDRFKRTPFPKKLLQILKDACVLLVGLGSVGSRIAIDLARAGIGHFKLADRDRFLIHNCMRHECDLSDLGRYKTDAIKEKILKINPFAEVETFSCDLFAKDNRKLLEKAFNATNLVIATTDRLEIQLLTNRVAWQKKIPALFAGCYEEAKAGGIFYVIPAQTVCCFECFAGIVKQSRQSSFDYSRARDEQEYKSEPGLYSSISLVSVVAEEFAIALLLRKENCKHTEILNPRANCLLIGGALAKDFPINKSFKFTMPFQFLSMRFQEPRKNCNTCQTQELSNQAKIEVSNIIRKIRNVPKELQKYV
jgi:molybdopterin/thiamine biosynthesis adenylyltransferase